MLSEALMCLALNVWHEARGEPMRGQVAVAEVTRRRVEDPRWPDDLCSVVYQPRQFSWTLLDMPAPSLPSPSWESAVLAAKLSASSSVTACADHYYNPDEADPAWASSPYVEEEKVIGQHRFMCSSW